MLESDIQKEILEWLTKRGFFCWRNSNMPTGHHRRQTYMPKGMPDVFVLSQGRFIGIEVKTNDPKSRLSQEQLAIGDKIQRYGGMYFVVRSLQELVELFGNEGILAPVEYNNTEFSHHT